MFLLSACPTGILSLGVELRHLRYVVAVPEMENVSRAVEAGTGVAIGTDVFGDSFGNRVKLLRLTPEPKPISIGIAAPKGRLSPAAEKFWQCAKEAAAARAKLES
jgi:DNA-binding transcriptional LysR family regulator